MINTKEKNQTKIQRISQYLIKILVLAMIYHLAARIGLSMAYVQPNTSPVWPPTGIAIAALLLFGYDLWPGISLGVVIGSLIPIGSQVTPWDLTIGMAIGNTLEALAGAYFLRRYINFHNTMDRIQDVVGLALAGAASTIISATIGVTTLMVTGRGSWEFFGAIWVTWWIGDLLGALVVAPLVLVWSKPPAWNQKSQRYLEGILLFCLLFLLIWYVFISQPAGGIAHQAMIYVIFPFMIWAAIRFGQRGAATAIFFVSWIAIWGTAQKLGPFYRESLNDSLVLLQTFMGIVSLTSLILAAASTERQKSAEDLRQRVDDLATLNDASKIFLGNFDIRTTYQSICQLAVEKFKVDVAWIDIIDAQLPGEAAKAVYGIDSRSIPALKEFWQDEGSLPSSNDVLIKDKNPKLHRNKNNKTNVISSTNRKIDYSAFAIFPLSFGNKVLGTLKLVSRSPGYFTTERNMLIHSFANLSAVAIQNVWLFDQVRSGNEQLHALSQRLMKAQEDERLQLSRELHDESGQLLAALMVRLGLLERNVEHPELAHEHILVLRRNANELQNNLHSLAVNLRPASLDHTGLVPALQQYAKDFSHQYNITVDLEAVGMKSKRLPYEIETALYRIVQESLTNVALHAQASRVDVLLSLRDHYLVAVVEDDGIGFIPDTIRGQDHLGLFGMRERIEMLGGKLAVESSPGKGTTVRVEVPYND
jgi:signal transduction histidine kinase